MPSSRRGRRGLLALVTLALTAGSVVGVAAEAQAAPLSSVAYVVNKPICSAPANPTAMRCFGLKRVTVPRGTAGSYRIHLTKGASADGTAGSTAAGVGAGPSGGYTPAQLASAYRFNPNLKRSNLTIGIVLWHDAPNVLSDLDKFDAKYKLPKETKRSFRKVNSKGKTSPLPKRDRGSAGEIALDTQAVRGVCHTCRILLVEADGPYDTDLAKAVNTAVHLGATIVTNSYGTPERHFPSTVLAAYRHPGVAVLASTGDSGWYGWDYANDPHYTGDNAASFPSTSPSVIAVGGTTLTLSAGQRKTETVWNNNGAHDANGFTRQQSLGASGGGCSRYFAAPAWQRQAPGYAATGCRGYRLATDVATLADPRTGYDIYDSYGSGGWVTVGGTSLSSPLAAGMLALAGGPRGARYPASALYANSVARAGSRYDVVSGGNAYCGIDTPKSCANGVALQTFGQHQNPNALGAGLLDCSFPRSSSEAIPAASRRECTAAPGFDGPSGVGAPTSPTLFSRTDPYISVRWSGKIRHRQARTFRVGFSAPLRGTTARKSTFTWGDGHHSSIGAKRSAKHAYRKAGKYTISLSVLDSRGDTMIVTKKVTVR